uniref:Ubiquitin-like protease family profile domain-containing protein n=1 Tax=Oryza barthii TaxID=65489 RepID=A0A0D3G518_9ORYZ
MKENILTNSSFDFQKPPVKKKKAHANTESSFTRFSVKYFSEVVSSLSDYQKSIIKKFEFDFLLMFDSSYVPIKFATWIANKVDVRTSEIIVKEKIILVTVESVHDILGLPLGGIPFSKDYERGRQCILSMFGQSVLPSVKFFGDLLIQQKDLSEDQIITSFLIVALACFLCPNSSLTPSVKYLTIFEDVLYLDNVDFGSRNVDQSCPRISVWKDDMISTFSELDKIDENTFGLRPLKDFQDTCYFKRDSTQSRSVIIQDKLDSAIGSMLPDFLKHEISEMLSSHCFSHHLVDSESCEDLVVSILSLIAKASGSDAVQDQNESDILHSQVNTEAGPSNFQPASPKDIQFDVPPINCSSLHSAPNIRSLRNDEPFDKSALKSIEKDCPSLDRIAALYGSSVNCDDGNNNESIHINDITVSQPVATPDVGYLRNINNDMNQSNAGSSVAAFSLVKNVANKFRSRLTQLNSRAAIFGEDRPSFRLLDSDDDVSDCDKDNELGVNALMQHGFISFHSVEDTPIKIIRGYENVGTKERTNCQNPNKRLFQDLTNSPDIQFLGQSKFADRCKKLCSKSDEIYNSSNNLSTSTQDSVPLVARYLYMALGDYDAVDIDGVKAKFGHSLKKGGFVSTFVMSVFCRVLFHNDHPSRSKKNYFFPSIVEKLPYDMSSTSVMEKLEKSFVGAGKARKLHLCDMLHFPVNFNHHWFLFVVDIKDRMLVILDSLHNEGDEYFRPILSQLIANLQIAWDKFVCVPMDFQRFQIVFPPVPRQDFSCDSGIYVMKFTELWSPRIILSTVLSNENIKNIRVQYSNQIFFHPKNRMVQTEIEDVVLNWFDQEKFPRTRQPTFTSAAQKKFCQ